MKDNTVAAASAHSHRKLQVQQKHVECPTRDFYRGGHSSDGEHDVAVMNVHQAWHSSNAKGYRSLGAVFPSTLIHHHV